MNSSQMTDQVQHMNKYETRKIVKLMIWPHKKRLQKKELAYLVKEGTVCQIVIRNPRIQWPLNMNTEENREWYYVDYLARFTNMSVQGLMSGCNDKARKQYQCE